ncbi:MAG: AAA family ATPase [Bacteroidota bacterium]
MASWLWSIPPDVYPAALRAGTLALRQQGRSRLDQIRAGDTIFAYLSGSQVIAGQFEAVGAPFEDTTALAPGRHLPHRLRVRPVAVLPSELWISKDSFVPTLRVLDDYTNLPPETRFRRVVQQVIHPLDAVDGLVLEFLIQSRLGTDPEALMEVVEAVREARRQPDADLRFDAGTSRPPVAAEPPGEYAGFDRALELARCIDAIESRGFVYEPWQIAAYVTAMRTKPFVLLAGVTGVGKSRLPVLVEEATGGASTLIPVRPDWTDPAETLGYTDLKGRFRPGAVLEAARRAAESLEQHHTLVLDEMNLARPEHYLAEVLSRMEWRAPTAEGYESPPLLTETLAPQDAAWQAVRLAPSLGIVGTVNVDESAHAFSRKVLDRAFVLEIEPRQLDAWVVDPMLEPIVSDVAWPAHAWTPRALRLGELVTLSAADRSAIDAVLDALADMNAILAPIGLGVGYRTRDEVALFVLHALEVSDAFVSRAEDSVDPLDLAMAMKVLPRIDGVRASTRRAVEALLIWAGPADEETHPMDVVELWMDLGRPAAFPDARFPRTAARLARIIEVADEDGVTSFWA